MCSDLLMATGVERLVMLEIALRQQKGIQKYGTTVSNNPLALREWLQHLLEELLDSAVYTKRIIEEYDKQFPPINKAEAPVPTLQEQPNQNQTQNKD